MASFHDSMNVYKQQLQQGDIQKAYQGLMEYFRDLRSHFTNIYPEYSVSSNIYYGYMDMTFFATIPQSLIGRKLKVAIVFLHDAFRFEVWLTGFNKNIQTKYLKLIKENGWDKYHIASAVKGVDYIIDHVLVEDPDFSDLDTLTQLIASGTMGFIKDVEGFVAMSEE